MPSKYRLQIVDEGGRVVVAWPPGGTAEQDFVSAIVAAIQARGVGWFRSEARVLGAIRGAVEETILAAKQGVTPA